MSLDELQQKLIDNLRASALWLPEEKKWQVHIDDNGILQKPYVTILGEGLHADLSSACELAFDSFLIKRSLYPIPR